MHVSENKTLKLHEYHSLLFSKKGSNYKKEKEKEKERGEKGKMQVESDTLELLNTYHPTLISYYEEIKTTPEVTIKIAMGNYGIEDWIRESAYKFLKDKGEENLLNILRAECRPYSSFNGSGKIIFIQPFTDEGIKAAAMEHGGAYDIVNVEGVSIMGKTRREISEMGPEFYFKTSSEEIVMEIPTAPEYIPTMMQVKEKYAEYFFDNVVKYMTSSICSVNNTKVAKTISSKVGKFVESVISNAIDNTDVNENGRIYSADDVLKMFQISNKLILGGVDTFKQNVIDNAKYNIGSVMIDWLEELPTFWKNMHKNYENNLTLEDEKKMVEQSISSSFDRFLRNPVGEFTNLVRSVRGIKVKHKDIEEREERVNHRANLYENFTIPCRFCFDKSCESEKHGHKIGTFTSYANNSPFCPHTLFGSKLKKDTEFARKMTQSAFKQKKSKNKDIKVVVLVRKNHKYDPGSCVIPVSGVKKEEDEEEGGGGKTKKIKKHILKAAGGDKVEYEIIGNQMLCKKDKSRFNVIEYRKSSYPNMLFLLETE